MKASVVQLRHRMGEVLKALKRNEEVEILYHGKPAGRIVPARRKRSHKSVTSHPLFGMSHASQTRRSVEKAVNALRGGRYGAL